MHSKAEKLHKYMFRPPRPVFRYEPWMDLLANIDDKRRSGKEIDNAAFREAYEAGMNGDMASVESFIGLYELGKD